MLVGLDRDRESLERAENNLKEYEGRYKLIKDNFGNIQSALEKNGYHYADGIILDLGISSNQVDKPLRGFSYQQDGPLDMRMDKELTVTAADILREYSARELTRIFRVYGEEKWASRIASFISEYRKKQEIKETGQLVDIIKAAVPARSRQKGAHPARRCFQALRIAVNKELEELENVLPQCLAILKEGGTLCVIAYHSLEDRMVKNFIRKEAKKCICPPGMPQCICEKKATLIMVNRRPVRPSEKEVKDNPRSRSALLRVARKDGL